MIHFDRMLKQAAQLPEDQKLTLAHRLLVSSETDSSSEALQAWDVEIRARVERYDQGQARIRPAGKVLRDLDRR